LGQRSIFLVDNVWVIVDFPGKGIAGLMFECVMLDLCEEMLKGVLVLCDLVVVLEELTIVVGNFMEKKRVDFFPFGIHIKLYDIEINV
jgi:hypothetical protein